jgi:hypothetical protein
LLEGIEIVVHLPFMPMIFDATPLRLGQWRVTRWRRGEYADE